MSNNNSTMIAAAAIVIALIAIGYNFISPGPMGPEGIQGPQGEAGPQGIQGVPGEDAPIPVGFPRSIDIDLSVSEPSNGQYFTQGETATVTVTLLDNYGMAFYPEDFSILWLFAYGPQDPMETVTAANLLDANTDRSTRPHHYIDLTSDGEVDGNVITYELQPVTDEEPGTYTVSLWVVLTEDQLEQTFELENIQIGTAEVETPVVEADNCASCHQGASNDQFYMHHVDPGFLPVGIPSIDSVPVATCKSCHNNDGYAAFSGVITDPDSDDVTPDNIVIRVHGLHMGEELNNTFNTDPVSGVFADYTEVAFPADVRNCDTCHVDDSWKTEPSRQACGTCHDDVWFDSPSSMPSNYAVMHEGGSTPDTSCSLCHTSNDEDALSVPAVHAIDLSTEYVVDLELSDPANGEYYVPGESPTLTISISDSETGDVVNPLTITEEDWSRFRLQVSGPKEDTEPVLTTAAADHSKSGSLSYIYNDLRVRTEPSDEDPMLSRTSTELVYELDDVAGLEPGTYQVFVQIRHVNTPSSLKVLKFLVETDEEEPEIATNCADCHGDTNIHGSYPYSEAPGLCKNCHDYERQLDNNGGWDDRNWGFGAAPMSRRVHGVHFGKYLDKPEEIHGEEDAEHFSGIIFPQDVRNCVKCHSESDMWTEEPSRLACLACHDSDEAWTHASLQTSDSTPDEPWNGDEVETCVVCHGKDRDFAPKIVHNIWDPYKPPYPREAEEAEH